MNQIDSAYLNNEVTRENAHGDEASYTDESEDKFHGQVSNEKYIIIKQKPKKDVKLTESTNTRNTN